MERKINYILVMKIDYLNKWGGLYRTYRHPKVAIVYGAGHFWFLYAKIRDMGFEEVKKKI